MCDTVHEFHGIINHYMDRLGISYLTEDKNHPLGFRTNEELFEMFMLLGYTAKRFTHIEEFEAFLKRYVENEERIQDEKSQRRS